MAIERWMGNNSPRGLRRKECAAVSLGQSTLLLPAWIEAALQANDRLKHTLSMLQSAAWRAAIPVHQTQWKDRCRRACGRSTAAWRNNRNVRS